MKNVLISFSALSILAVASCKKSYSPPANAGHVMFVNACSGAVDINVASKNALVFSSNVNSYPDAIPYLSSSKYLDVPAGIDSIFFTLDPYDTLVTGTVTVSENLFYSVFATGSTARPAYAAVADVLLPLSPGMAEVRLVDLSFDLQGKTTTIGNEVIDANQYGASSFRYVPQGTYNINVGDAENSNQASISGAFGDGKIYTIIVTGAALGGNPSNLAVAIIENNQLLN